jgi:hypothetical protein
MIARVYVSAGERRYLFLAFRDALQHIQGRVHPNSASGAKASGLASRSLVPSTTITFRTSHENAMAISNISYCICCFSLKLY